MVRVLGLGYIAIQRGFELCKFLLAVRVYVYVCVHWSVFILYPLPFLMTEDGSLLSYNEFIGSAANVPGWLPSYDAERGATVSSASNWKAVSSNDHYDVVCQVGMSTVSVASNRSGVLLTSCDVTVLRFSFQQMFL